MTDECPWLYNLCILQNQDKGLFEVVVLGETPGWVKTHKDLLDKSPAIGLIPKDSGTGLPSVWVPLNENKKWVMFSRVRGQITGGHLYLARTYAIGYQDRTTREVHLTWVDDTGIVFVGEVGIDFAH